MSRIDILERMKTKDYEFFEVDFDNMMIPPMWYYLTPQDVEYLRKIATSLKLSAKINEKYRMIDELMVARGFKRFAAGTNRVVYQYLEDERFLAKIAIDRTGMQDNPLEFKNQNYLKPYVAKMFYCSPCGTVGFAERVIPITSRAEFRQIAEAYAYMLVYKILGKYVVDDVGDKYFCNVGIRKGLGPVLLDYPYVYPLDGNKLICNQILETGERCGGSIDYDGGFNEIICLKCGRRYYASELRDDNFRNKNIILKGGKIPMKVEVKCGNEVICAPMQSSDYITKGKVAKHSKKKTTFAPYISGVEVKAVTVEKEEEPKKAENPFGVYITGMEPEKVQEEPKTPPKKHFDLSEEENPQIAKVEETVTTSEDNEEEKIDDTMSSNEVIAILSNTKVDQKFIADLIMEEMAINGATSMIVYKIDNDVSVPFATRDNENNIIVYTSVDHEEIVRNAIPKIGTRKKIDPEDNREGSLDSDVVDAPKPKKASSSKKSTSTKKSSGTSKSKSTSKK